MEQPAHLNGSPSSFMRHDSGESIQPILAQATVLMATVDSAISESMRELLGMFPLKTIWVTAVAEVKAVLAKENVAACFCGFWLVDGTYRDVVRHLKHRPVEIPAVIVCAPECPHEYREYLEALKIRAFDFICHPYRKSDLDRILRAATSNFRQSAQLHDW
jgi:DNA-binding NtrC family response regulator